VCPLRRPEKKNPPGTNPGGEFKQGGFTSGRRKGPKNGPLFQAGRLETLWFNVFSVYSAIMRTEKVKICCGATNLMVDI